MVSAIEFHIHQIAEKIDSIVTTLGKVRAILYVGEKVLSTRKKAERHMEQRIEKDLKQACKTNDIRILQDALIAIDNLISMTNDFIVRESPILPPDVVKEGQEDLMVWQKVRAQIVRLIGVARKYKMQPGEDGNRKMSAYVHQEYAMLQQLYQGVTKREESEIAKIVADAGSRVPHLESKLGALKADIEKISTSIAAD